MRTINRQTESQAADDQLAEDKSVRALLSTYREGRPLVLLMDDRYALFPYDLTGKGIYMAILGMYSLRLYSAKSFNSSRHDRIQDFIVLHMPGVDFHSIRRYAEPNVTIAEFQPAPSNGRGRVVRYKFAFQWCEDQVSCEFLSSRRLDKPLDQGQPWWFENAPTSNGMSTCIPLLQASDFMEPRSLSSC